MKLIEAANKAYSVIRKSDSKKLFADSREECIAFIKGFDRGSPKYVDLRLINPSGKEDDWHKD